MGKQARQKARQEARKGLSLRKALLTSPLLKRYEVALVHITSFFAECGLRVATIDNLDSAVGAWVEHIFFEGESKSLASDGLASLQYHLPQAAGHLRFSWKLVKAWNKLEPPARVVPLSPLLTRAFAGALVLAGHFSEAALMLVAFDALLRPGEMYQLRAEDVTFYGNKAVLTLYDSKTGKRTNTGEMVVINSRLANYWLRRACAEQNNQGPLLPSGAPAFRLLFSNLVAHFQLDGLYAVYGLRRGGATYDFLLRQSMERTLLRGRWSSTSTARIYLQDTIANVANLKLSPVQEAHAKLAAAALEPGSHR